MEELREMIQILQIILLPLTGIILSPYWCGRCTRTYGSRSNAHARYLHGVRGGKPMGSC